MSGILKGKYSENQFDLYPEKLLSQNDGNTDATLSLQEALRGKSGSGLQKFIKNCAGPTKWEKKLLYMIFK